MNCNELGKNEIANQIIKIYENNQDIVNNSKTRREYAGKMMGLSAYGKVDRQSKLDVDIAATSQKNFANKLLSNLERHITDIPIILTGGCALNVLVNEKIKMFLNTSEISSRLISDLRLGLPIILNAAESL